MSFAERHKAWLLPLLGLGVAGVAYLNLRTPSRPAAAPVAMPAPAPAPPPPPTPTGGSDLWSDLRNLEAPWAALNQSEEILRRCERPVDAAPAPRPRFNPDRWGRLPRPRPPFRPVQTGPPPKLDPPPPIAFVGSTPSGSFAWIAGRAWQEGSILPGGFRLKRILLDRVVFEGPAGPEERLLVPQPNQGPRVKAEAR